MPKSACAHGSTARGQLHLHWCSKCALWRYYHLSSRWLPNERRGGLSRWSDPELVGLGDLALEGYEIGDSVRLLQSVLLRVQADELDARELWQQRGAQSLLQRVLEGPQHKA